MSFIKKCTILLLILSSQLALCQIAFPIGDLLPGEDQVDYYNEASEAVSMGGYHYFRFNDGAHGPELWRSDGTQAGTSMVVDIQPGAINAGTVYPITVGSKPEHLIEYNEALYFSATYAGYGRELWRSDGTQAGSELFYEFTPGQANAEIKKILATASTLFIHEKDQLYVSDGTTAGTVQLIADGVVDVFEANDVIYINRTQLGINALWATDGTQAGTRELNTGFGDYFTHVAGITYFSGTNPDTGTEPWRSDGTVEGTVLVKDINHGTSSSYARGFTLLGASVVFYAGGKLWVSDGTTAGTESIPGSYNLSRDNLIIASLGSSVVFIAIRVNTQTLWVTDGTEAGTLELAQNPSSANWSFKALGTLNGNFYYRYGTQEYKLWKTDGTLVGTQQLASFDLFIDDVAFSAANRLYFIAGDSSTGREIYSTDGTPEGTAPLADFNHSKAGAFASYRPVQAFGDLALISAPTGFRQAQLWATSGYAPPVQLYDGYSSIPTIANGYAWFAAEDSVWRTDGTVLGTQAYLPLAGVWNVITIGAVAYVIAESGLYRLQDGSLNRLLNGGMPYYRSAYVEHQGWLYFLKIYTDHVILRKVHTDGSSSQVVAQLDTYSYNSSYSTRLQVVGNKLFCTITTETQGMALYCYDTLSGDFGILRDINPGSASAWPTDLAVLDGQLYFTADDGIHGQELWRSDGTEAGTELVADIYPGQGSAFLVNRGNTGYNHLSVYNNRLYFAATDAEHGLELWSSDGTGPGTTLLADIQLGSGSGLGEYDHFQEHQGLLYFTGNNGNQGAELWATNGTTEGTHQVIDLAPGPESSLPSSPLPLGNDLFFFAFDPAIGWEPHVMRAAPEPSFSTAEMHCAGSPSTASGRELHPNANFTWTLTGGTLVSGQGSDEISFNVGDGPNLQIDLTVDVDGIQANSSQTLSVVTSLPAQPGTITGLSTICAFEEVVFQVPDEGDADSWLWQVPDNALISAGQGSNLITVDFGINGGDVSVSAVNTCGASSARVLPITLTLARPAFAGSDQVLCETQTSLQANSSPNHTGQWLILSGSGGAFEESSNPNTDFNGLAGEAYQLQWTLAHDCGSSTDTVVIHFAPAEAPADAGPDQDSCSSWVTLAGNAPIHGYGIWQNLTGNGGSFDDPFDAGTLFRGRPGQAYSLLWTLRSKPCIETSDQVDIILGHSANAGPNSCTTANVPVSLQATGEGIWSVASGPSLDESQFADRHDPHTQFTPIAGQGTYQLTWSFETANCGILSDELAVTVVSSSIIAPRYLAALGGPSSNNPPSNPRDGVNMGGFLYFIADHPDKGALLWRTNGHQAELVVDVLPTYSDSASIRGLTLVDDRLFFWTFDSGDSGLWVSNGEPGNVKLVTRESSFTDQRVGYNGYLYYQSSSSIYRANEHGPELLSQGSLLGSAMGLFLFTSHGQIWAGDGSTAGSWSLTPGQTLSDVSASFIELDQRLIFCNSRQLWSNDGTPGSSLLLYEMDGNYCPTLVRYGSHAYFVNDDEATGKELWRSDGTPEGTFMVKDIQLGEGDGLGDIFGYSQLFVGDSGLYFFANDGSGRRLWLSDGSAPGTRPGLENVAEFYPVANQVYMLRHISGAIELWLGDGTSGGSSFVSEVPQRYPPSFFTNINDVILFPATYHGKGLWRSDGTAKGTFMLADLTNPTSDDVAEGIVFNGTLFFTDRANYGRLFTSDGTVAGTSEFDLLDGDISAPSGLTIWQNQLYFGARNSRGSTSLYRSDGTLAGTQTLIDGNSIQNITVADDQFYFMKDNQLLYVSDGTSAGTLLVADFSWSTSYGETIGMMAPWQGQLYFLFSPTHRNWEIWQSDGSPAGTRKSSFSDYSVNENTFLMGTDGALLVIDRNIYATDGSDGPLTLLRNTNQTPYKVTPFGEQVLISTLTNLWISDTTVAGTTPLFDANISWASNARWDLTIMGETAYVAASKEDGQSELWQTDGTPENTRMIDLNGARSSFARFPSVLGDRLVFLAQGDTAGLEPWQFTPSDNCALRIADLYPGVNYHNMKRVLGDEQRLFFIGGSSEQRWAIWSLEAAAMTQVDPQLNAYLVTHFDDNGDGLIDSIEAQAVTDLDLRQQGIHELAGLEQYGNLRTIRLGGNPISDLSPLMTQPELGMSPGDTVDVSGIMLTSDDCTQLTALESRTSASGAAFFYQEQGDLEFQPGYQQWPEYNVLGLLAGVSVAPYRLDCAGSIIDKGPPEQTASLHHREVRQ